MSMSKGYPQAGVAVTCRSFKEYVLLFDLNEADLHSGKLLDIAAGASSFTADACARGIDAYAVDPRYAKPHEQLVSEAREEIDVSTTKLISLGNKYDLSYYGSFEQHRAGRIASLDAFAEHHDREEERTKRYQAGSLPTLPYGDGEFGLVLCSHFLFLYEDQFDYEFHLRAVMEMLRVCKPGGMVRIYPMISLRWEPYSELERLRADLSKNGVVTGLFRSKLPFIPGSELGLFAHI
ncbi:class I SAM-dependent methyltransferase [Paenibacillus sp. OV219]|uniref:class I SAM-dependent methyltransferase n=1 Tax=Paenibacillus sp. OV219 TaxID=1884377 RepID=UPI0008C68733|nr:methyltransferase domain-containing protein [Paenibacillus sp. OV219]SEO24120.1 Methyltransferase domain-containing protein [Paenibacillus sp. OV219]